MLVTRLTCPHCSRMLQLRQPVDVGRLVLCNACNRTFAAQAEAPPPAVPVMRPPAVLRPVPPAPPPPPAPRPAPPGMSRGLLIALVAGALVFLLGSTAIALTLVLLQDRRHAAAPEPPEPATPPAAEAPRPPDAAPPAPRPPVDPRPGDAPRPPDLSPGDGRPPAPAAPHRTWLPRELQDEVNRAIDHGIAYLKKKQLVNGTWENAHTTGMAALPGLTLLECGVPASDPCVQKAASYVRRHAAKLQSGKDTYELSLVLLFLDRLGEASDRPLIRTIALRLIAGQTADGGWTYSLPLLSRDEEDALEKALEMTRPRHLERFVRRPDGGMPGRGVLRPGEGSIDRVVQTPGSDGKSRPVAGSDGKAPEGTIPLPGDREKSEPKGPLTDEEIKRQLDDLPPRVRSVHAVRKAGVEVRRGPNIVGGISDNSNTQFATLALWAAGRHGIPMERTLDLLAERFRRTQMPDGSWKYHPTTQPHAPGTPAMTGAGLLGLAVGHGLTADPSRRERVRDAGIEKGLEALGRHIGKPLGTDKPRRSARGGRRPLFSPINLYFLWTVERVGVLYDAPRIGDKDWYRWGVEQLLEWQKDDGHWEEGNYWGSSAKVDTCLGLLFLKRANLAADLTGKLEFVIEGKPSAP